MSSPRTLRCENWHRADADLVTRLYRDECRRWHDALAWDYEPSCRIVEAARLAGRLPGLLARRGHGRVAGWSFFVPHEGRLQIGGLIGDSDATRRELLRGVLASPEAAAARAASCFLFPQSSSLRRSLEREGFEVDVHRYMASRLPSTPPSQPSSWGGPLVGGVLGEQDAAGLVDLLARAYEGNREAICFAPDGRLDQWAHYLAQLVETEVCGRYLPAASLALRDGDGRLVAATVVTRVGGDTAHLVQVAVDPAWRGRGLANGLVRESGSVVAGLGYRRLTLIVAEENASARRVYRTLGFEDRATFLYGQRSALRVHDGAAGGRSDDAPVGG